MLIKTKKYFLIGNLPVRLKRSEIIFDLILRSNGESLKKRKNIFFIHERSVIHLINSNTRKHNQTLAALLFVLYRVQRSYTQIRATILYHTTTYQASDGERLTSRTHGRRLSSIRMSKPYTSADKKEQKYFNANMWHTCTYWSPAECLKLNSSRQIYSGMPLPDHWKLRRFWNEKSGKNKDLFSYFWYTSMCCFYMKQKTEKRLFYITLNRSCTFMSDIGNKQWCKIQWCNKQVQNEGS